MKNQDCLIKNDEPSLLSRIELFAHFWRQHQYILPQEIFEQGIRLLATAPEALRNHHSPYHLTKIVHAFCRFEAQLLSQNAGSGKKKRIYIRPIKIHGVEASALGLVIALKVHSKEERLSFEQVERAISHLIPGVIMIPEKLYLYRDDQKQIHFLYVEIETMRRQSLEKEVATRLNEHLAQELEESVESLSPALFYVRNEEEIFRNSVQMSRELNHTSDIPQVAIFFQKQTPNGCLQYTVVIVRIVTEATEHLQELRAKLPKTLKCILEMTTEIGSVSKTSPKQANLATFELDSALFARKNGSIDLRAARAYVAKGLELMIGPYRDYNGGLISKQSRQLKEIKEIIEDSKKLLIESLFYSFNPPLFQAFILPEAAKACTNLFMEAMNQPLPTKKTFLLFEKEGDDYSTLIIKTSEESLQEKMQSELTKLSLPLHQFGYVIKYIEGEYYLALIYQYPNNSSIFDTIKQYLNQPSPISKPKSHFIRLNFQDGDPRSLSPLLGIDFRCRALQKALFEGLTRIGPDLKPRLAAAEHVEISDDGKTYLFTLRSLQWSNGEEMTAFQFERTWKHAILSPSCLRPDIFFVIKNARKARYQSANIHDIGVRALDSRTLEVTLEYPAPYFLEMLALPLFFPTYEEKGDPHVFSGPFILQTWEKNKRILLVKNPYYWDFEHVGIEGIEISMLRDPYLAYERYLEKQLDWIGGPFSLLPLEITSNIQDQLKRVDTSGVSWLYCNLEQPLLASAKVRRALSLSLDREAISKRAFLTPIPCSTQLPPQLSSLSPSDTQEKDVLALFEEGLQEQKYSLKKLPPLRFYHSHITGQKELALEIQKNWEQTFGIQIEREEASWHIFAQQLDRRLFHFGSCYRHPYYHNPMYYLNIFYEPTNIHNPFGWQSESYNDWVDKARQTPSASEYLKNAELELFNQMPVIPIHTISYHYLARKGIEGIQISHSGDVDFRWIYLN